MMIVNDEHIPSQSRISCALILNLNFKRESLFVDLSESRILVLNGYFIYGEKIIVYKPYQIRSKKVIKWCPRESQTLLYQAVERKLGKRENEDKIPPSISRIFVVECHKFVKMLSQILAPSFASWVYKPQDNNCIQKFKFMACPCRLVVQLWQQRPNWVWPTVRDILSAGSWTTPSRGGRQISGPIYYFMRRLITPGLGFC